MIETVLRSHFSRYPALEIQDMYKLLHQAALGSEHAVSDHQSARNWLTRELAEMGKGPMEPLVDPISADGGIARIHLRPYIAAGHDPELLLAVFIRTGKEYQGEYRQFELFWQAAIDMRYFSAEKMEEFIQPLKKKGYPAVHHSSKFQKMYQPAYRVVATTFCPKSWFGSIPNG